MSKTIRDDVTLSAIESLNEEQRVREIARMLGGVEVTDITLAHASELLHPKSASGGARSTPKNSPKLKLHGWQSEQPARRVDRQHQEKDAADPVYPFQWQTVEQFAAGEDAE